MSSNKARKPNSLAVLRLLPMSKLGKLDINPAWSETLQFFNPFGKLCNQKNLLFMEQGKGDIFQLNMNNDLDQGCAICGPQAKCNPRSEILWHPWRIPNVVRDVKFCGLEWHTYHLHLKKADLKTKRYSSPFWMNTTISLCFEAYLCVATACVANSDSPAKYSRSLKLARAQKWLHISGLNQSTDLKWRLDYLHKYVEFVCRIFNLK